MAIVNMTQDQLSAAASSVTTVYPPPISIGGLSGARLTFFIADSAAPKEMRGQMVVEVALEGVPTKMYLASNGNIPKDEVESMMRTLNRHIVAARVDAGAKVAT